MEGNTFRANVEAAVRLIGGPDVTLTGNKLEGNEVVDRVETRAD
jgi:hypothetical protein